VAAIPNRVQLETVEVMLATARRAAPILRRYLRARTRALGADPDAGLPVGIRHHPLPGSDGDAHSEPRADVAQAVIDAFAAASPGLAAFARRALGEGWVDAAPRPEKNPIATCMHWSALGASRISMAHDGSAAATVTLAHELGHAYHAELLYQRGPTPVDLPISLAETASLVAEGLVRSRLADGALTLLDSELAGATKWLVDAGQTLALERRILAMRREGPLSAQALCDATADVMQEWFGPMQRPFRPYWASQFLFWLPGHIGVALPYLLAYLFASRVLTRAREPGFAEDWAALLVDAEVGSLEELAEEHLSLDLADPTTWDPVIASLQAKVERFERLATP